MTERAKGPASYFPSIEKTYGRPVAEWQADMRATGLTGHKALVTWLKEEHGIGHGHATARTAHLLAQDTPRAADEDLVDALFPPRKAHWRPTYDRLVTACRGFGEVEVRPKKSLVGIGTRAQFAMLQPSTPARFDVGLKLPGVAPAGRLESAGTWNTRMTHRVRLTDAAQVDDELLGWLRQAYDGSRFA